MTQRRTSRSKKKQIAKPNQILINNANKLPLDTDFRNFLNLVLIKQLNNDFNGKLSIEEKDLKVILSLSQKNILNYELL